MVIRTAQCNIRSLNTSSKLIEDMCKLQDISILSLSEIWHPDVSSLKFLHKWNWNMSIRARREGGGAAVLINPKIKTHPRKDINNPSVEAVWCEIYVKNKKILLGSVYIPPGNEYEMGLFIDIMDSISRSNRDVIIMGDLNAKHPMWYNNESNKLGEKLSEYLNNAEYNIVNNHMYTYKSSVIDLTLVKGCTNLISNWSAYPDIFVNTDHTMIMFNLSLKVEKEGKPKWNTRKADWEVWKHQTRESFQPVLETIKQNEQPNINADYTNVKETIHELGKKCIGKTLGKKNTKPWWNNEISANYKEYKKKLNVM